MKKITSETEFPISEIGNKCYNLQSLLRFGINVPKTYVLTVDELVNNRTQDFSAFLGGTWIFRSSPVESMAGILDSKKVNVNSVDDIQNIIGEVKGSWVSPLAVKYRNYKEMAHDFNMAIIVQEYVDAEISGVCNSINPSDGKLSMVGEWVDGELSRYCLGEVDGKSINLLPLEKYQQLFFLLEKCEEYNKFPAEVEWVFCERRQQIFAVQLRNAHLTTKAFGRWWDYEKNIIRRPIHKEKFLLNIYDIKNYIEFETDAKSIVDGEYISGNIFTGEVTFDINKCDKKKIYVGEISSDEDFAKMFNMGGIVIVSGGKYSHITDQARKQNIPCTYLPVRKIQNLKEGQIVTIANGSIYDGKVEGKFCYPYKHYFV